MIIYLVTNKTNGKRYVGKTKRTLEQRWKEHVRNALIGCAEMPLYDAIRKHGPEAFELTLLEVPVDLNEAERRWIGQLGTFSRGYNAILGGDGVSGWSPSPEHREKIRQAHLGERNHNYGKSWGRSGPHSDETKRKLREINLGRKHTEEAKAKIGKAQYVQVVQYDMRGNHIATFDSMVAAEAATGVHRASISRCCRFPHRSARGFKFMYVQKGAQ